VRFLSLLLPGKIPERMPRRRLVVAIFLLALLTLGGCQSSSSRPIMVFCSPDSPRLRQLIAGLEAGLGQGALKKVCVPELGPAGDKALRSIRRHRPRLLVVLGTPALIMAGPKEKRLPIVFAGVADPFFTGVAYDPEHPEIHQENVTGIASPPPMPVALGLGARLLGAATWGMLYDPTDGEAVVLADRFTLLAPRFGLTPVLETSSSPDTDRPALDRLRARGAKVIFLPAAASAARYAPLLMAWGRELKVWVVSANPEAPHNGAVIRITIDYHRLGEETAYLVQQVLNGDPPAKIPIIESTPLRLQVDEALLRKWSGYPPPRQ